jgi:enoyl-CoA hydratase / 3-hydroxyacyl-CoA dehydrogenase
MKTEHEKKLYPTLKNPLLMTPSRPMPKEIAIIGAGTIGPDIGYYLKSALPSIKLYLVDVAEKALESAEKRLSMYAKKAVDKKKMKADHAKAVLENIIYTTDYSKIKDCDLVIEAATESIPLKQKIFDSIEQIVSAESIITSNTSSIPVDRLFSMMKYPERTSVTHFFAPAWRSLPVEVITWERADRKTVDYLFWFFAKTGKVPIISDNAICFILDRVFDNWCNESAIFLENATASQIDKTAEEFVFAGPFFVLNMANGNPIIVETNTLQMEEGAHYRPASILNSVRKWNTHRPGSKVRVPQDIQNRIRDRLLGILFSQSFDIINRGIGTKADLNFGCQVALGFKKGPLDIMQKIGQSEVDRIMKKFQDERPGFPKAVESFSEYQNFYRFILVDEINNIKVITIRRPQAMNALNDQVTDEILSVLKEYSDDPAIKGFIITGYGNNAFSAGADIGRFPEMLGDSTKSAQYARDCAKVQQFMDQMDKPVVAALNGIALGGGFELAIRCHAIVALKKARVQFPEISLGILPGIGGCIVPYRKWPGGSKLFNKMVILGKSVKADQAFEIGMIDKLAKDYTELIQRAVNEIDRLQGKIERIPDQGVEIPDLPFPDYETLKKLNLSKEAVSITIETIKQGAAADKLSQALETGYKGFGKIACTQAAKEGISAFLEKRRPVFTN